MSIILIFLVHHLIHFFKTTLTVPKIKDLVHSPNQKYKDIFDTISNSNMMNKTNNNTNNMNNYTSIDLLPINLTTELPTELPNELSNELPNEFPKELQSSSMKNELKNFLKKQMNVVETAPKDVFNNFASF